MLHQAVQSTYAIKTTRQHTSMDESKSDKYSDNVSLHAMQPQAIINQK